MLLLLALASLLLVIVQSDPLCKSKRRGETDPCAKLKIDQCYANEDCEWFGVSLLWELATEAKPFNVDFTKLKDPEPKNSKKDIKAMPVPNDLPISKSSETPKFQEADLTKQRLMNVWLNFLLTLFTFNLFF